MHRGSGEENYKATVHEGSCVKHLINSLMSGPCITDIQGMREYYLLKSI